MNKKVLLITGASSDIGIELIKQEYQNFDIILAHYTSNDTELNNLKKKLGEKIILFQSDFLIKEDTYKLVEEIKRKGYIPTHIVHLSAGKFENMKFHKLSWDKFEKDINIALRSITIILNEFLPIMSKNKYGKVIMMLTSCTLNIPPKYLSSYVTSKYALLGLLKSLSNEYSGKGITINGVSPSMIETKFLDNIPSIVIEQNAQNSPTGKNLTVNDVVPTIQFLLSDNSNCITGINIPVTNGNIM